MDVVEEGGGFEEDDQTAWEVAAAAAAAEVVESDAEDLGRAAEWALKAARKLEKKGRLLPIVDICREEEEKEMDLATLMMSSGDDFEDLTKRFSTVPTPTSGRCCAAT